MDEIILLLVSTISLLVTLLFYLHNFTLLKKENMMFKKIKENLSSNLNRVIGIQKNDMKQENMNDIMYLFKNSYLKMIKSNGNKKNDLYIIIKKYIKSNNYFKPIYHIYDNPELFFEANIKTTKLLPNIYQNDNSEFLKKIFDSKEVNFIGDIKHFLSYIITDNDKAIGALVIYSSNKINERYCYENIKELIKIIEPYIINYIKNYPNSTMVDSSISCDCCILA